MQITNMQIYQDKIHMLTKCGDVFIVTVKFLIENTERFEKLIDQYYNNKMGCGEKKSYISGLKDYIIGTKLDALTTGPKAYVEGEDFKVLTMNGSTNGEYDT